jgi:hypothetical protein
MTTNDKLLAIFEHTQKLMFALRKDLDARQQADIDIEVNNIYIALNPRVVTNLDDINPE